MRLRSSRFWIGGSAVVLTALVWSSVGLLLADERTVSTTIPVFAHRWFIVDLSYHRLQDMMDDSSATRVYHEVRVRAGTENTTTDTYHQYADMTIPIWPLLIGDDQ